MKAIISTKDAIRVSKELLSNGVMPNFIMLALIADGFENKKAETILSWAKKQVIKELETITNLVS